MKARGIVNATRRLLGAYQLGSGTLIRRAEEEGEKTLLQARAWIERKQQLETASGADYESVVDAADILQDTLHSQGRPAVLRSVQTAQ